MADAATILKQVHRAGDDYYAMLGVDKSADEDAIKKAYKKTALRIHPDKCKEDGAEEAFKKVGEAMSVLSDADKRRQYDQFGVDGVRGGGGGGGGAGPSPEDIFEAFFGGGGMPPGATFMRAGGGGRPGVQTFHFSSGGGPGGGVFHFSSMGGGGMPGGFGGGFPGMHQRVGGRPGRGPQPGQEEREEEPPAWLKALQRVGSNLGPLAPFSGIFMIAFLVIFMMLAKVMLEFLMSRAYIIIPVMYLTEGRTKAMLLSGVVVLAALGVV